MRYTAVITSALLIVAGCASGPDRAVRGEIDPRVEGILRDVSTLLSSTKFSFRAETTYEELAYEDVLGEDSADEDAPTGAEEAEEDRDVTITIVEHIGHSDFTVARPSQLRVSYHGDRARRELFLNGKMATLVSPDEGIYATLTTPGTIDTSLDALWGKAGVAPPLSDLVYADAFSRLEPKILGSTYAGLQDVDGTSCHHILLAQETMDWQLWVGADGKQLPVKMQITYRDLPLAPMFIAVFKDWNFEPAVSAETFTFVPPAGAIKVDAMATPIRGTTPREGS